jgi:transposase InsO family protein
VANRPGLAAGLGRRAQLLNAIDTHRDDPSVRLPVFSTTVKRLRRRSPKTPGPTVHDGLVGRHVHTERPNQIWLTDITEHPTGEGKLYLCAIKDVCSRRIVGYALGERMTSQLTDAALRIAIARRSPSVALRVRLTEAA